MGTKGLLYRPEGKTKVALMDITRTQFIIAAHQNIRNTLQSVAIQLLDEAHPKLKVNEVQYTIDQDNYNLIDETGAVVHETNKEEMSYKYFKLATRSMRAAKWFADTLKDKTKLATKLVEEDFGIDISTGKYIYQEEQNFIEPNPNYSPPFSVVEKENNEEDPEPRKFEPINPIEED